MQINNISDFRRAMRNGPYAWPGGYPCFFVMSDGEAISFKAAKENIREILEDLRAYCDDYRSSGFAYTTDWRPIAFEINYEDASLYCAHTGERIESAYAED
jgi:hypothetical protein